MAFFFQGVESGRIDDVGTLLDAFVQPTFMLDAARATQKRCRLPILREPTQLVDRFADLGSSFLRAGKTDSPDGSGHPTGEKVKERAPNWSLQHLGRVCE